MLFYMENVDLILQYGRWKWAIFFIKQMEVPKNKPGDNPGQNLGYGTLIKQCCQIVKQSFEMV